MFTKKKDSNDKKITQNLIHTIKTTKYMIGFVWEEKNGKIYLLMKMIIALFDSVYPLLFTVFPGLIINELINDKQINVLVLYVGILTIAPVLVYTLKTIINRQIEKLSMIINLSINKHFLDHYTSMDYESVENPEIGIMQERAQATLNGALGTVNTLGGLVTAIFSLIAISSIISMLNPLLLVLIVGITYINSLITKMINKKMYIIGKEISEFDRYQSSANYMLYMSIYAKEIRLFGLKTFLISHYERFATKCNILRLKKHTVGVIPGIFASVLNFVQQIILYVYLLINVLKYELPIGNMTIFLTAVQQLSDCLNGVLNSYLSLSNASLSIQETIEFMNIPLKQHNTGNKIPIFDNNSIIEFKNVSFKYPGSDNYAIKNMSIKIHSNEKLCIVGANGSGKSTFIKLLSRLYWPTKGEILLNGTSIYDYSYEEYQRLFSPVFQDFCGYFMSIRDNIVLNNKYEQKRLEQICYNSGLINLVNKLPKGYDTQVGKWIDDEGIQPSGGEFQKIAIARAIYHDSPIFLLDEPTAALDPLIEYEIYKQFNDMITNKTAILITHRLSAVQLADKIAVFDNGSVIEYGTHKELYKMGGMYTEMFDKQAHFYRDNV